MTTVMISHNLIYIKKTTSSYIEMQIDATDLSSDHCRDKIRCDHYQTQQFKFIWIIYMKNFTKMMLLIFKKKLHRNIWWSEIYRSARRNKFNTEEIILSLLDFPYERQKNSNGNLSIPAFSRNLKRFYITNCFCERFRC